MMSEDSLQGSDTAITETGTTETNATETTEKVTVATTGTSKIYVGPNIPKEGLNRFKIYQEGTPEHFEQLLSACPTVKKLFVDVDSLSTVLNQIEQTGSAYHKWYATVVNYVKGV